MSYKSFNGKWRVYADSPIISILPTGLFCFNTVCYERFIKPANYKYVKLYYDPEAKKIAFELLTGKPGEPIRLVKTERIALVSGKAFLSQFGIKYEGEVRSYPVHETTIHENTSGQGYKDRWIGVKGIEIRLDEIKN